MHIVSSLSISVCFVVCGLCLRVGRCLNIMNSCGVSRNAKVVLVTCSQVCKCLCRAKGLGGDLIPLWASNVLLVMDGWCSETSADLDFFCVNSETLNCFGSIMYCTACSITDVVSIAVIIYSLMLSTFELAIDGKLNVCACGTAIYGLQRTLKYDFLYFWVFPFSLV